MGKYILCSTARSFKGTILLVGAINNRNHAYPSLTQIFLHFTTIKVMLAIKMKENNIAQSVVNSVNGNPLSTLRLKGNINFTK